MAWCPVPSSGTEGYLAGYLAGVAGYVLPSGPCEIPLRYMRVLQKAENAQIDDPAADVKAPQQRGGFFPVQTGAFRCREERLAVAESTGLMCSISGARLLFRARRRCGSAGTAASATRARSRCCAQPYAHAPMPYAHPPMPCAHLPIPCAHPPMSCAHPLMHTLLCTPSYAHRYALCTPSSARPYALGTPSYTHPPVD
eukprot:498297-Rhodomonas_salina.1